MSNGSDAEELESRIRKQLVLWTVCVHLAVDIVDELQRKKKAH